jgi:TRAP-type mannitol/chloroaromatic compound transport system substrate-binding protein
MKRRAFLYGGLGTVAACAPADDTRLERSSSETHSWRMVTSWPPNFPGFGASANRLAERIGELSDGRIDIDVFAAGELIPAFEVFDAVARGTMQMGHSSPTYWRGSLPAAPVFSSVPFGMLADEHKAWLDHGGGVELWREIYGARGIVPFVAGNTGAQMGGWFKKEIRSPADLVGLKMRISGLGGDVIQRAGAVAVSLPGAELYTSLSTGVIDATEWNGPFNDMAFGLHEVARYYYYPGWHEPGPCLEAVINLEAWNELPEDLQELVRSACMAANMDLHAEYTWGNAMALDQLMQNPNVELRELPRDVLDLLKSLASEAIGELTAKNEWARRINDSCQDFLVKSAANQKISEFSYLANR